MPSIKHFKRLLFAQTLESNSKCGHIDTQQRKNPCMKPFKPLVD